jgi:hypothetical protein
VLPSDKSIHFLAMAMVRLALVLMVGAVAVWPQDVGTILRRIDELIPKESLGNGIETELRAAFLLRESHPEHSAKFLQRGKARLVAHPELVPTKWMVTSLFSLEPNRRRGDHSSTPKACGISAALGALSIAKSSIARPVTISDEAAVRKILASAGLKP